MTAILSQPQSVNWLVDLKDAVFLYELWYPSLSYVTGNISGYHSDIKVGIMTTHHDNILQSMTVKRIFIRFIYFLTVDGD